MSIFIFISQLFAFFLSEISVTGSYIKADVIVSDIMCSNGVIHVIDNLIHVPTRNILDEMKRHPEIRYWVVLTISLGVHYLCLGLWSRHPYKLLTLFYSFSKVPNDLVFIWLCIFYLPFVLNYRIAHGCIFESCQCVTIVIKGKYNLRIQKPLNEV